MILLYNYVSLWCNGCCFLCPLKKQQWKLSPNTTSLGEQSVRSGTFIIRSSVRFQYGLILWVTHSLQHYCNWFCLTSQLQSSLGFPADPSLASIAVNKLSCTKKSWEQMRKLQKAKLYDHPSVSLSLKTQKKRV